MSAEKTRCGDYHCGDPAGIGPGCRGHHDGQKRV